MKPLLMPHIVRIFCFYLAFFSIIEAQIWDTKPDWVRRYQKGKSIKSALDYYYGIGTSKKSQSEADIKAREEFAISVEVKVKSIFEEEIKEKNRRVFEFSRYSLSELTEISIKGITVTERYEDLRKRTYYSLIKIRKDEYNRIKYGEIKRELERQQMELQRQMLSHQIEEQAAREKTRHWWELWEIKKEEFLRKKVYYREFLQNQPPGKVITLRNGQLSSRTHELSFGIGIVPVSISSLYYAYRFWQLELILNMGFRDNQLQQQDLSLKFQLLPNTGEFYKTSISFGFVEYVGSISEMDLKEVQPKYSPFIAGNITVPIWYNSYISFYGDFKKVSLGINNFIFYENLKDKVSFLFQIDFILAEDFRNRFVDPVLFQIGLRFKTFRNISSSLTYEDHELFVFSVDISI